MQNRKAVLCADDYGIAPGVGHAIRELIAAGRLSATSCMTATRHWPREAELLRDHADHADIGLHLTLTDQRPLGRLPRIAPDGRLPSLGRLMRLAYSGRLDSTEIADEIERQLDAFEERLGRPPAFLDGHHHAHQLPVIGAAVIDVFRRRLARVGAYLRFTDEPISAVWRRRVAILRASTVSLVAKDFSGRARALGIAGNNSFRGVRSFARGERFASLFASFMADPEMTTIVMCHPGLPDDALAAVDPVTAPRDEEYRFLASEECGRLLDRLGVEIARFHG